MKDLKSGYLISLKQKAWLSLKGSHALGNETRTFFIKIDFMAFGVELLLISNAESICLFQGFQKRYITFPQMQGLKRYEVSKFKKLKSCQIYLVKRTFFSELELCRLRTVFEGCVIYDIMVGFKMVLIPKSKWPDIAG